MSTTTEMCPICISKLKKNDQITCFNCSFIACKSCIKKYILTTEKEAICMNCNITYNARFLKHNFDLKWLNGRLSEQYRGHLEKVCLENEKKQLTNTLSNLNYYTDYVEAEHQKKIGLQKVEECKQQLFQAKIEYEKQCQQVLECNQKLTNYRRELIRNSTDSISNQKKETTTYICPCPTLDCKGLIESKDYKCKICKNELCKNCHKIITTTTDHECNDDDVQSVQLLLKNAKRCPNCAIPIQKNAGCDQLFCTVCKTIFSWTTLNIENGFVHNPYALDWIKENRSTNRVNSNLTHFGLNQLDCFELSNQYIQPFYYQYPDFFNEKILHILNQIIHMNDQMYLPYYEQISTTNLDFLRASYLLNELTEEQWSTDIFKIQKNKNKKQIMDNVITTTKTLLLDICRNYFINILPRLKFNDHIEQQITKNNIEQEWEIVRNWANETIMEEMSIILVKNPNLFCEWFDLVSYSDYLIGYPRKKSEMSSEERRRYECSGAVSSKRQKTK